MTRDQLKAFLVPVMTWFEAQAKASPSSYDDWLVWMFKQALGINFVLDMIVKIVNGFIPTPAPGPAPAPTPTPGPIIIGGVGAADPFGHPALSGWNPPFSNTPGVGAFPWAIFVPIALKIFEMLFRR